MKFARLIAFVMEAGIPREHYTPELFRFAMFLIEDEREACAKLAEQFGSNLVEDAIKKRDEE